MKGVTIRELAVFDDHRGWLSEIFRSDETEFRPVMSYISVTNAGAARGPHEHEEQSDFFCFTGNFRLYLWDNRKDSPTYKEKIVLDTGGKPHIAVVPPGIVHAYKNIGTEAAMVINLPDRLYRGEGKTNAVDEIRHEDDPASPFSLE